MANDNWQKVREIFDSALRRKPEERQNFVHEACDGNKTLLAEVQSLLASLDSAESFMETPAVAKVAEVIEAETKKLETGRCFGHYEIIKQIGAGGMGEVYLVKDKKLDRQVAIKILNEKFSGHESNLNRFISEAKAASALNHPNILVIHEIGADGDVHFIVSEFIKGKTLRERMVRTAGGSGRVVGGNQSTQRANDYPPATAGGSDSYTLKLAEILDYSIQIANALSAAHEARLIHRDIKPENIMIRPDGFVKVLDFGLAKLVRRENKSILGLEESTIRQNQTAKGVILGTVNYMSPEQAKGERVDERTDIFSLGVLVYEMIGGRTPFAGDSTAETFANLINQEPQPLSRFIENIPPELERIVSKMLRKGKDERYQTMKGLLADLKELRENLSLEAKLERSISPQNGNATEVLQATTGDANLPTAQTQNSISLAIKQRPLAAFAIIALLIGSMALGYYFYTAKNTALGGKKSIAVLPLKPINTANRDEIYEMGIADSLILRMNSIKGFIVRPLSATRKYSDVAQDPIAAGKEQQVDYVLASNYQIAGGKIRITSQLFNVATGQIEETYKSEKDASDLFVMQDAIADEVGNKLLARFATTSSSPVAKRGTTNEEAYRLYLQGKNLTMKRNQADAKKAVEYFEQAIQLDPNYALAYVGMARAYSATGTLLGGRAREAYEKARAAVSKAAELDANSADVYAVRGFLILQYEWNFAGAEKDLTTAIELEPNNDSAHWGYAMLLNHQGRFEEALAELQIAQEIDPNLLVYSHERGRFFYFARRYDEAIVQLERVLEVDKNFNIASGWLFRTYEMKGDYAKAYEWFIKDQKQRKPERIEDYQKAYETGGWQNVNRKILEFEKLDEQMSATNYYQIARQLALLNEKEQAFEYLNKALEAGQSQMTMLKVEPAFDSLRDDPRFNELLRRVGLK